MNREEKKRIVGQLIETRGKLQRAQLELALDGEDTEELQARLDELDATIDALRRALHERWQGRARTIEQDLRQANRRVQGRIRDIRKRIRRAERVVALLGDVDEIIAKVTRVLG